MKRQFTSKVQEDQKKANVKLVQDFNEENIPVKLHHESSPWGVSWMQSLMIIALIRQSDVGLPRKIKKVALHKGLKLFWELYVENIPVKLQYDACNS